MAVLSRLYSAKIHCKRQMCLVHTPTQPEMMVVIVVSPVDNESVTKDQV